MTAPFAQTLLQILGVGIAFVSLYYWARGLMDIRAARQWHVGRRGPAWLESPFTSKPSQYYGLGKQYVEDSRRCWVRALVYGTISSFILAILNTLDR